MCDSNFSKSEVVSAFIKSMRFGDLEEASYWCTVLLENNISETYIAKRLAIFAAEDCFDSELMVLANSVYLMYEIKIGNSNMFWQVLYRCCKAKKFWEMSEGKEYEETINRAAKRYKTNGIEKIPRWAIDAHTRKYYELIENGRNKETDERFSGNDIGRLHMIKMHQKYRRISPDIIDDEIWEEAKKEIEE